MGKRTPTGELQTNAHYRGLSTSPPLNKFGRQSLSVPGVEKILILFLVVVKHEALRVLKLQLAHS